MTERIAVFGSMFLSIALTIVDLSPALSPIRTPDPKTPPLRTRAEYTIPAYDFH